MEIPGSTKSRLAILCLVVGLVLHIISFSSPYWYTAAVPELHGGLWQICVVHVGCGTLDNLKLSGVFHFVQAAEAIALIFGVLSVGTVLWLMSSHSGHKVNICGSLTLAAGVIVLCGIITFLVKISDGNGWAAYLEFPACASMIVSGVLFLLEGRSFSGVIVLCGIITFLVKISDGNGWAAYLEFPACASMIVSGVLFLLEGRSFSGSYQVLS